MGSSVILLMQVRERKTIKSEALLVTDFANYKVNATGIILQFGTKSHQLSLCGFSLHLDMVERGSSIAVKYQNENLKLHDA